MLHWVLGKYIAYSFNEPKKYPKKPILGNDAKREMTAEEMAAVAKRNCIRLGGEIRDGEYDSQ